jgi:predicted lipoprotein with Yx(FWY)xxD motif
MRKQSRKIVGVVAITMLGLIGFLAADQVAGSATGSRATLSLRQTKLGSILVNAQGRTLYLFARDRSGSSTCNATCAKFWPPLLIRSKPTAGPGLNPRLVGTTRRANGSVQVTYNRHPLYTFALDTAPGQANGQGRSGFGARWFAVSAKGRAMSGTTATTTTATTTATTGTETTRTTITDPYP